LANVTSTSTYQDLGLVAGTVTGTYTAAALFVKVNTAVTNGTCDITVFGDVISL